MADMELSLIHSCAVLSFCTVHIFHTSVWGVLLSRICIPTVSTPLTPLECNWTANVYEILTNESKFGKLNTYIKNKLYNSEKFPVHTMVIAKGLESMISELHAWWLASGNKYSHSWQSKTFFLSLDICHTLTENCNRIKYQKMQQFPGHYIWM